MIMSRIDFCKTNESDGCYEEIDFLVKYIDSRLSVNFQSWILRDKSKSMFTNVLLNKFWQNIGEYFIII